MDFDKIKTEMAVRRCEQILKKMNIIDDSERLIQLLMNCLDSNQKEMFMNCLDEINRVQSAAEEEIYFTGFVDGITLATEYTIKDLKK